MTLLIPPLPPAWPYPPRAEVQEWERREDIDLGSFGGGWTLTTPPALQIPELAAPLPGAFGRGGIQRRGNLVLRPYRRGGLVRFLVRSRYPSPRRFEREWLVHRALWEAGFPTPQPLGYGFRRQGLAFEGIYVTAFMEGKPWPADWEGGRARLAALVEGVAALSGWGLWAPDLNATNVLLTESGLVLLDWDRSAFLPGSDLVPLYRRRLLRSLTKLGAPGWILQDLLAAMQDRGPGGR